MDRETQALIAATKAICRTTFGREANELCMCGTTARACCALELYGQQATAAIAAYLEIKDAPPALSPDLSEAMLERQAAIARITRNVMATPGEFYRIAWPRRAWHWLGAAIASMVRDNGERQQSSH